MRHINIDSLERDLPVLSQRFRNAQPFEFIVLDDFLDPDSCQGLLDDHIASEGQDAWNSYVHFNERKLGLSAMERMGTHTRDVLEELSSPRFLSWLQDLSGIDDLVFDPDLDGGGYHKIGRGGFLNVHTDFLAHNIRPHWSRQLNLLVYLNKDWQDEYGGHLELWDEQMTKAHEVVPPVFNRCVIFHTTENSYHGHPDPLACPQDMARRSLALYYFREEAEKLPIKSTHYRGRPHESVAKKALIALDRMAVRAYSGAKRSLGLRDHHITKLYKLFGKSSS